MKFYVAFDNRHNHKLGNHILNDKTIAVFDCEGDLMDARNKCDELFGEHWYVRGDWSIEQLLSRLEHTKRKLVDITSEI
jgi:hypothetical protein